MAAGVQTSYSTAPAAAYAGMLADDTNNEVMTMINAEASTSMPFGIVCSFKTTSPASDRDACLPTATETKLAGVVCHAHDYERQFALPDGTNAGELDSTGLVPGTVMAVLWRGTIWVKVQQAVVPGDRLFVCKSANTVYTAKGQVGNADESSNTIDATAIGRFLSSAKIGGFAKLQVDFSQKQ
jgi:hypothetical protein